MASVIYGKCYLWQMYYGKCNYGKNIYGKNIMANETEPYMFCYFALSKVKNVQLLICNGLFLLLSWGIGYKVNS